MALSHLWGGVYKTYDITLATPPFRRRPETVFPYSNLSWMPFFNGMTIRGGVAEKVTCALSGN